MIDSIAILQKYKNNPNNKQHGRASHGGKIIGIEVDLDNRIYYVVNRGGNLVVEDYKTAQPKLTPNMGATTIKIPPIQPGTAGNPGTV